MELGLQPFAPDVQPAEFMAVVERQAALYAGLNTSLRQETLEELAAGAAFCMRLAGPAAGQGWARFAAGQKKARALSGRARSLWRAAVRTAPVHQNRACRDTLAAIPAFWTGYDASYFAHHIPCDIDYPLLLPVNEGHQGPQFLCAWLRAFCHEAMFVAAIDPADHLRALRAYVPDWEGQLVNLCEPALQAALLGRGTTAPALCAELGLGEEATAYIVRAADTFLPHWRAAGYNERPLV